MTFHNYYKSLATGPLNFPMRDDDARDLEKKLNTGDYDRFRKFSTSADITNVKERSDISIISDDTIDDDKEVFDTKTFNWDRHKKNPIVAFNHDYSIPPVGKCLWTKFVGGNVWKAKTQYISCPEHVEKSKWLPSTLFYMIKEGYLPGKSIGGISKKRQPIESDPTHWKSAKSVLYDVNIYEYSVVPVQCNPNAIVESVSKGMVDIPKDIMIDAFPEVHELMKQFETAQDEYNASLPVIKSFRTVKEYETEQQQQLVEGVAKLLEDTPNMVKDAIEVMCGRV